MAIYSCNLKSIGRTTHAPGTAGAHIRYIARPEANPVLLAEHMPLDPAAARNWIDRAERAARKNARVLDKIRLALPRELDETGRAALVEEYMATLTGGRPVPWYAAIHQTGADAHNPHVHIAVHDRDRQTGRRALRLSDSSRDRHKAGLPGPKAVEWIRAEWEEVCNRALERAGHDARVDRRSLEEQGVARTAPIHVGPRASHIDGVVRRPASRRRINGCGRAIDYPAIDQGKTRREFNAHVIDLNLERAARSSNPVTAAWAAFEKDELARDRALEDRLAAERHQRTAERRDAANRYNARIDAIRAEARLKKREAERTVAARFAALREKAQRRYRRQRQALKERQGRLYARIMAALDITGTTKRRQQQAQRAASARYQEERRTLAEQYRAAKKAAVAAVRERYERRRLEMREKRNRYIARLRERHRKATRLADRERQRRETDREQMRRLTERKIAAWQKTGKTAAPAAREDRTEDEALARAFRKAARGKERSSRTQEGGRTRGGGGSS